MATSGSFLTSDSGRGGGIYYGRMQFIWERTGWGYTDGVGYHDIRYRLTTYGGSSSGWQMFYNGSMNVDGQGHSFASPTQAYGGGATSFGWYSKRLLTDSAGNRGFSASAQGGIYTSAINTSGSGSWSLDNIPISAAITGGSTSFNDEQNPTLTYSNPAGNNASILQAGIWLPDGVTTATGYINISKTASSYTFNLTEPQRDTLRSWAANSKSITVRVYLRSVVGGNDSRPYSNMTLTIVNANPVFTTAEYHDSNSATVAITGNDQAIVQNQSNLTLDIDSGNRATALKGASIVSYTANINGVAKDIPYTTGDISSSLGVVDAGTNQNLAVTATDSRGNVTTVTVPVTMIPYLPPVVNANPEREDGFEEDTTIDISASYSPIIVASVEKNSVNNTTGIGYKVWEVGTSEPGSYTNVASTSSSGSVTIPTDTLVTLDRSKEYNLKVKITDAIQTVTNSMVIGVGIAAFRIGLDGNLYNNGERVLTEGGGSWITPTMLNGWVNYDTSWASAGYYKDSLGIVHLRGLVKNGTAGSTIFTVPAGYRIAQPSHGATASNGGYAEYNIFTDGRVQHRGTNTGWFSLDHITWKADA